MRESRRRHDGFTLVELMTVVLIIFALTSIAIPLLSGSSKRAAAATCLANRAIVADAGTRYRTQEGTSAPTLAAMTQRQVLARTPACPSKGVYVWSSRTSGGKDELFCSVHYAGLAPPLWTSLWANLTGFATTMGTWSVANGLVTGDPNSYQNRGMFGDPTWTDVRIDTNAVLTAGAGYGIYFRARQDANGPTGYCFQYDPGLGNKFVVRKVVNGVESGPIATASMPAGFSVYNTSHPISVQTVGNRIVVTVDGKVALDFVDSSFSSGQAGLRTWSKSAASFGGLTVSKATP